MFSKYTCTGFQIMYKFITLHTLAFIRSPFDHTYMITTSIVHLTRVYIDHFH